MGDPEGVGDTEEGEDEDVAGEEGEDEDMNEEGEEEAEEEDEGEEPLAKEPAVVKAQAAKDKKDAEAVAKYKALFPAHTPGPASAPAQKRVSFAAEVLWKLYVARNFLTETGPDRPNRPRPPEMALESVCGADFWCNRHCKPSPVVLSGFRAGLQPASRPAACKPAGRPACSLQASWDLPALRGLW